MNYGNPPPGNGAAPPPGMPQWHRPNEEKVRADYEQHKQQNSSRGEALPFLKFLGPQGETRWTGVRPGYESELIVRVLPPWSQEGLVYQISYTHFWKSQQNPKGTGMECLRDECLICAATKSAFETAQTEEQLERVKQLARVRKQYFYNVILEGALQAHVQQDGTLRPFILAASSTLYDAMSNIFEARGGVSKIIAPDAGRALRLKKTKTGPNEMNVEYSAIDMDPSPVPQEFWPLYNSLWDLSKLIKRPTQEQMTAAVQDMRLTVPTQNTAAYNPNPQAPAPNPYQPQQPQPQPQPQQQFQYPGQPAPQQQQQQYRPQQQQQDFNPPAVASSNYPQQSNYAPQPSQGLPPPPPPPPNGPQGGADDNQPF